MTAELRYAQFADFSRICKFLDQYWERNYIYVRKPELFKWTFGRTDLWDQEGYSIALMEDKDELVGILGAIPFEFNCLGQTQRAVWIVNHLVSPDHRRGPLAMKLLSAFRRSPYDVNIAFGLSSHLVPMYQIMRWKVLKAIPRHFAILPNATKRASRVIALAHADWDADRAEALADRFRIDKIIAPPTVPFSRSVPETWDRRDWPLMASNTIGAARDKNYLTWRYLNHPCFEYRFRAVPEGDRTGILVWRLETIRQSTISRSEDIDRIGRVVEFLPVSRNNAGNLLSILWHELLEADALGADYYGYHGEHEIWLEEFGFRATETHPDGQMMPALFQPLDSNPATVLGAVVAQGDLPCYPGEAHSVWYWTKSDSDQDRPN